MKGYVVGAWDAHACKHARKQYLHVCKQKLYLCPSQLQSLAEDLQLTEVEGQMDGKLWSSGEGGTNGKDLLHVCVALPMIMGAWLMAVVLW